MKAFLAYTIGTAFAAFHLLNNALASIAPAL